MQARLLVVLAACAAFSSQASASDTAVWGGPGGNAFRVTCDPGSYLIGFAGRTGQWLDQLRPICARWELFEQRFGQPQVGNSISDSTGGYQQLAFSKRCPVSTYAIDDLDFYMTVDEDIRPKFVSTIFVKCRTARMPADVQEFSVGLTKDYEHVRPAGLSFESTPLRPHGHVTCPPGELAVGLHGRSGLFVDALGLACAPAPSIKSGVETARTSLDRPWQATGRVGTALGGTTCNAGFVPRKAGPNDDVCVTPESQARVLQENANAQSRRDPKGGPYGPNTCLAGFVWRGAFNGDFVCVTPEARDFVRRENEAASTRSVGPTQLMRR